MSVPKSVQRQADEASAHYESLNRNPDDEAPAPAEGDSPKGPEGTTQPAEKPGDTESPKKEEEPKRSESYWEHRFNVINGKYAAEVPALRDEVKQLKGQVQEKDAEIKRLTDSLASSNASSGTGLTDEQMKDFKDVVGEDVVEYVVRMIDSRARSSSEVDDLRKTVDELQQERKQTQEEKRQEKESLFWKVLEELCDDWEEINGNPKFHAYLSKFDPATGIQRQQALEKAHAALDADSVAAIFNGFKKETAPAPEPEVDPQRSRATQTPQNERIWTGAEISQFYRDKTAGKYSAEEAQRLEADIFAAQRQGRVR